MVHVHDVIICANFSDDRLRGSGLVGVKFYPSPLTLIVVLTTLPHNLLLLIITTIRFSIRFPSSVPEENFVKVTQPSTFHPPAVSKH